MSDLFRFPSAVRHDPEVFAWFAGRKGELAAIAKCWFQAILECGEDVNQCIQDGHPTACVFDVAFAYVNVFKAHVNVGFFRGSELHDPKELLHGSGKLMRHVKIRPEEELDEHELNLLIKKSYVDMKSRVKNEQS